MAGWLSKLFGGARNGGADPRSAGSQYKDCVIVPGPIREGDQWRLAGSIHKSVDGEERVRRFIRSDLFSSREQAENQAISKGELIIDQRGDDLFADPDATDPV